MMRGKQAQLCFLMVFYRPDSQSEQKSVRVWPSHIAPLDRLKGDKYPAFLYRLRSKVWGEIWPKLTFITEQ